MSRYIMRLDDASEYMDAMKWKQMEILLDKYNIKPIVGVIPANQDPDMVGIYPKDGHFWEKVQRWKEKGWTIALHGYTHVFETNCGGLNPVNHRSEFAGVPLERQKEKIRLGYSTLTKHGIKPEIFFAPAHTFDENTLVALREESDIRIISDTIANDIYSACQKSLAEFADTCRRIKWKSFSVGACTWQKILFRLQVCELFAAGGQGVRVADCKNLSKKPARGFSTV